MKINRHNYELYFLDHLEGKLSSDLEKELEDFLQSNPDLKPLLKQFDPTPLPQPEIMNDHLKKRIKKSILPTENINEVNIEEWLIREMEEDLSYSEKEELDKFLVNNPAYAFDRKVYGLTKMKADPAISYQQKENLKRKAPLITVRYLLWAASPVAAAVLILLGIRYFQKDVEINPLSTREVMAKIEPIRKAGLGAVEHNYAKGMESRGTPSHYIAPRRINPIVSTTLQIREHEIPVELTLSNNHNKQTLAPEPEEKRRIARLLGNMFVSVKEDIASNSTLPDISNSEVNFWAVAQVGVKGFSGLTGRDLELYVRRNDEGKVTSYALMEDNQTLLSKDRTRY